MKSKVLWLGILFVVSIATVAVIVTRVNHGQQRAFAKQGFTLVITQTAYPEGKPPVWVDTTVRYQKADGSWKKESTYFTGHRDVGFGQMGRGVFRVDEKNQKLDYLSEMTGSYTDFATNENRLRSDPKFVGEETILGFKTFHLHSDFPESEQYLDIYICPALQGYPLKRVSGDSKGNKTVFETTQVVLGEPSFTVENYPVDTKHYETVHGQKP